MQVSSRVWVVEKAGCESLTGPSTTSNSECSTLLQKEMEVLLSMANGVRFLDQLACDGKKMTKTQTKTKTQDIDSGQD